MCEPDDSAQSYPSITEYKIFMHLSPINSPEDGSHSDSAQPLSPGHYREVLFETNRLQLVRAIPADIPHFVAVYCSPEMMTHLGQPFSQYQAASRIETWDRQWNELGWGGGVVVDRTTSASIGTAKLILTKMPDYIGSHEVGYMILRQYQGKGFAREIATGAVRYLFERVLAQCIVADVHPENSPSNRLLEKLGFLDQGIRNYTQPDFAGYNRQRIWRLPREKWEAENK